MFGPGIEPVSMMAMSARTDRFYLDLPAEDFDERFPLKVLWERTKALPSTGLRCNTILVLSDLDLASLVVARHIVRTMQ